jgi:sporulation protein YlmC with PRC-barrel domain
VNVRPGALAQEHQMGTEQNTPAAAGGHAGGSRRLVASENARGAPVYAPDGNRLGRIERVMADEATGEIVHAIVNFSPGKGIGFETDDHPVPWSLLTYNPRFDGYELRIASKR